VESKAVLFQELDQEWMDLMFEAKSLGLELSAIRVFLQENGAQEK
jgi:DNA-binding transcriptional MerR regulator